MLVIIMSTDNSADHFGTLQIYLNIVYLKASASSFVEKWGRGDEAVEHEMAF